MRVRVRQSQAGWRCQVSAGLRRRRLIWLAIDPVTKLIVACHVGSRRAEMRESFVEDIAWRLDSRVQLSTDGHAPYVEAVEAAFGAEIDFAQLVKSHRVDDDGTSG